MHIVSENSLRHLSFSEIIYRLKRVQKYSTLFNYFYVKGVEFLTVSFEIDPVKRLSKSNFIQHLQIKPYRNDNGNIELELKVDDHVLNLNDTLHGGVHASLLDTIIGQSIAQQAKSPVATINLSVFYSAPARKNSILTAKATIVQRGNSIATGEGTIIDEHGTLIAKAIGSFKILNPKKSR